MRKISFVLAAVAVTGLTVAAKAAPETTIFLDTRDNTAGQQSIGTPAPPYTIGQGDFPNDSGPAGGGKGGGQVLRVSPTIGGANGPLITGATKYPNFDNDANASTGSLWMYADVGQDAGAVGNDDVISSIGFDMFITTSALTPRFDIATVNWAWDNFDIPANSGKANGVSSRTGVVGAKYVKVPVSATSTYATAGGLTPPAVGTTLYRLGELKIAGAARDFATPGVCGNSGNTPTHSNNSTYEVRLGVNNLLITRTFSNVVADIDERVSFGYFNGVVEADVSGNTSPTVQGAGGNVNRDAVIQVRMKHDSNGSGHVNGFDIPGFVAAQAAGAGISQVQRYLYDNVAPNNVNGFDIPNFTAYQTAPCP